MPGSPRSPRPRQAAFTSTTPTVEPALHVHLGRGHDPAPDGGPGRGPSRGRRPAQLVLISTSPREPAGRRARPTERDRHVRGGRPGSRAQRDPGRCVRAVRAQDQHPASTGSLDRPQPDRSLRHFRRGGPAAGALREEVEAATEEPDLTIDSRDATVRSAALMSTGTLVSRGTGLIRVSATLAALGLTALSDTYNAANTTPNIVYELLLGGILTSVFVPVFVEQLREERRAVGDREPDPHDHRRRPRPVARSSGSSSAPWIMRLYLAGVTDAVQRAQQVELGTTSSGGSCPRWCSTGSPPSPSGILTAHRRFAAQAYAPVLNNLAVIATMLAFIAMRGEACTPSIELPRGRADAPGGRDDPRRGRDGPRPVAVAASARLPAAAAVRCPARRVRSLLRAAPAGSSSTWSPTRWPTCVIINLNQRVGPGPTPRIRRRSSSSRSPTRSSPSPS